MAAKGVFFPYGVRWTSGLLLGVLGVGMQLLASGPPPTPPVPAKVSTIGIIAGPDEPGERLIITGQVFGPDGRTPAPGVLVYAYQTDATGLYHNDAQRVARLHGWAKTDSEGRFEFHTVRPGAYPERDIAAHVHFH